MKNTSKVLGSQSHWLCAAAIIAAIGLMLLPLTGCDTPDKGPETVETDIVATPTANPAGGTYTSAQSVSLSSTTTGAAIYYTTNGTAPTTSSTLYSTAISINTTTILKAFAVKDDMDDSDILTATYTINLPASIPELTVGKWTDASITTTVASTSTTAGGEQWFKFTTAEAQTSASIHFMPTGTLKGAYVQLYASSLSDLG